MPRPTFHLANEPNRGYGEMGRATSTGPGLGSGKAPTRAFRRATPLLPAGAYSEPHPLYGWQFRRPLRCLCGRMTIRIVPRNPQQPPIRLPGRSQHVLRLRWGRGERATLHMVGPHARQVEATVQGGAPQRRDGRRKDGHLANHPLALGTAPLTLHTDGIGTLLDETGFIKDGERLRVTKLFRDEPPVPGEPRLKCLEVGRPTIQLGMHGTLLATGVSQRQAGRT